MNPARRLFTVILHLLSIGIAGAAVVPAPPRSPTIEEIPVTSRFVDQPVVRVLEALFAAAGTRAEIDPCATGRISIELRNVTLGAALDAVARIADLEVKRTEGPARFRVSCRDVEGRRATARNRARGDDVVTLHFRLERIDPDGTRETEAQPRLRVVVGEQSEISETERVPQYALTEDGEIYVRSRRPNWTLSAVVVATPSGVSRELRGILEIARGREGGSDEAVCTAVKPFHLELPEPGDVAEAVQIELGGRTWVLSVEIAGR
jgi:hypothetical protein